MLNFLLRLYSLAEKILLSCRIKLVCKTGNRCIFEEQKTQWHLAVDHLDEASESGG